MFRYDISVIRAVQSDRIQRDVMACAEPAVAPRGSSFRAARRQVGRSIVRVGARIAAEGQTEQALDLAGSR